MTQSLRIVLVLLASSFFTQAIAHDVARARDDARPIAEFPDVGQRKVLSVDLHTHSVFSDGHVWPSIRAEEAARDVIDAVAITEHLEWQPHLADIPHEDRNRSYNEAARAAQDLDLLVIPGVEITRTGEPGHINAVFIQDANPLVKASGIKDYAAEHVFETKAQAVAAAKAVSEAFAGAHEIQRDGAAFWAPFSDRSLYMALVNFGVAVERDPREVLEAAAAQGAFTFWNHPSFSSTKAKLPAFHRAAVRSRLLHGIEIANGQHYYPNAHRLALKHNLAFIGTSDVHQLIAWDYDREENQHRPLTLVLADERSSEAIKEALFQRRTMVWWNHTLIGRSAELQPLLEASITLEKVKIGNWGRAQLFLRNHSGADFQVTGAGNSGLTLAAAPFVLAGKSITRVDLHTDKPTGTLKLNVLNALVDVDQPAQLDIPFTVPSQSPAP